jgi:hypothetical protein
VGPVWNNGHREELECGFGGLKCAAMDLTQENCGNKYIYIIYILFPQFPGDKWLRFLEGKLRVVLPSSAVYYQE